jgi:hypothetical protein
MNAYLLLLDWKEKSFTFESKAKTNDKDLIDKLTNAILNYDLSVVKKIEEETGFNLLKD